MAGFLEIRDISRWRDVHNLQWIEILEKNPEKIFWLNETGWNQEGKTDDVARETLTEQQKITPEYISHEYLTLVIKVPTYSEKSDAMFVVSLDQAYMEELFREVLEMALF